MQWVVALKIICTRRLFAVNLFANYVTLYYIQSHPSIVVGQFLSNEIRNEPISAVVATVDRSYIGLVLWCLPYGLLKIIFKRHRNFQ